jgi:hypothetical protein
MTNRQPACCQEYGHNDFQADSEHASTPWKNRLISPVYRLMSKASCHVGHPVVYGGILQMSVDIARAATIATLAIPIRKN